MREERQVDGQVDRAGWFEVAAVDVDDVAERHKREEGDADREGDGDQRQDTAGADGMHDVVDVEGEEAVVLEPAEQAEEGDHRPGQGQAPAAVVGGAVDDAGADVGGGGGAGEQKHEPPVPPAVEEVAEGEHRQLPRPRVGVEQPVRREGDGEEDREVDGGKEHWGSVASPRVAVPPRARPGTLRRLPRRGRADGPPADGFRGRSGPAAGAGQLRACSASMSFGRTLWTSPTMPRSATEKMGAS